MGHEGSDRRLKTIDGGNIGAGGIDQPNEAKFERRGLEVGTVDCGHAAADLDYVTSAERQYMIGGG